MVRVQEILPRQKITPSCSTTKMKFKNPNKSNGVTELKELLIEKGIITETEFKNKIKNKDV